jgi:hypothetical protein
MHTTFKALPLGARFRIPGNTGLWRKNSQELATFIWESSGGATPQRFAPETTVEEV